MCSSSFPGDNGYRGALDNGCFQLGMLQSSQGDYRNAKKLADQIVANGIEFFDAAKILAACVPAVESDNDLDDADRKDIVQQLTKQSVNRLRDSLESDRYKNQDLPSQIKNDPALKPIRGHDLFKQLVKELD